MTNSHNDKTLWSYRVPIRTATVALVTVLAMPIDSVLGREFLNITADNVDDRIDVLEVKAERRATDGLPQGNRDLGKDCADINIGADDGSESGFGSRKKVVVVEGPVVQECP